MRLRRYLVASPPCVTSSLRTPNYVRPRRRLAGSLAMAGGRPLPRRPAWRLRRYELRHRRQVVSSVAARLEISPAAVEVVIRPEAQEGEHGHGAQDAATADDGG